MCLCISIIFFLEFIKHHKQVQCALCGWPMCSEECSRRKPHANLECSLFRYRNGYDDVEDDDGGGGGGDNHK